jgi:hypothetical protein
MTNHDRAKYGRAAIAAGQPDDDLREFQKAVATIVNVLHAVDELGLIMTPGAAHAIAWKTFQKEQSPEPCVS